jgi:tRNA/tmRNA/rRNA uracil-C5-methylase (TrmA/RlmC/RlmD family)
MKNEKLNWEVEQMKKDIKKHNANVVWKEIETSPVWHYRVKLRKSFFEAIKQLKVKFEME